MSILQRQVEGKRFSQGDRRVPNFRLFLPLWDWLDMEADAVNCIWDIVLEELDGMVLLSGVSCRHEDAAKQHGARTARLASHTLAHGPFAPHLAVMLQLLDQGAAFIMQVDLQVVHHLLSWSQQSPAAIICISTQSQLVMHGHQSTR